ncbi:MAG: ATP-dependent DNA helicase RecG [Saccharofermentanales bacterium]
MSSSTSKVPGIPGLSARRQEMLAKLGIFSEEDLIGFFPRDYEDWTKPKPIAELQPNEIETFIACVEGKPVIRHKGRMSILKTTLKDPYGFRIFATWFNQPYYQDKLVPGQSYLLRGKIRRNGFVTEIVNPIFEIFNEGEQAGIKPVYRLTAGLTQGVIRRLVAHALQSALPGITDCLPDEIRKKYTLCSAGYAYEKIHTPQNSEEFDIARRRLAFEELFMIQAGLRLVKSTVMRKGQASALLGDKAMLADFYKGLPFVLTDSQQNVVNEILHDISQEVPMNRLIQGDVGSGKTVIAAAAAYICLKNGMQATLMAPTSVLANQHYATMTKFLPEYESRIALLTGNVTGKKRKEVLAGTENGSIQLLIGTHAVLEDTVKFTRLALAITDEQHRFGVKQRSRLGKSDEISPHVLVMSATPIPRTLGFVLYGDLDISTVRGLPGGRVPIDTYTSSSADDPRVFRLIDRQIDEGRQVYIVCPMIEATMESDLVSVKELYEDMKNTVFAHRRVGLLHGAMNAKEKTAVMDEFMSGRTDILVSTTVIEVGVDNPNASIMLIQNAERFGLAQLHQLRGRIGRGTYKSICILRSDNDQEQVRDRLKTLCRHSDGFVIAEKDLALRGMGDFFGTRQHGIPEMKIANLYRDTELLEESKEAVASIFDRDPLLESPGNRTIVPHIRKQFGGLLDNVGI